MFKAQRGLIPLAAALLFLAGCSREYYAQDADRQVYSILTDYRTGEFGSAAPFTIDDGPSRNVNRGAEAILGDLPAAGALPEWLAESSLKEVKSPLREIDLAAALRLARRNSREFQTRKETLYLSALSLTAQQHDFDWLFGLSGSVAGAVQNEDRDRLFLTGADAGVSKQLATGTLLALDLGLTGVKYLNHELGTTLESALSASITQPLWRGADTIVVRNGLIQAQRDVVYGLRTFVRYEKTFSVSVASSYYNVLLSLDKVKNQYENYRNLTAARERNELLAQAGRIQVLELEQARQSELQAHNSYLTSVQSFERSLDSFRVLIGLPVDAAAVLSRQDLDRLSGAGIKPIRTDPAAAAEIAIAQRLDLKNTRGAVEDADRGVFVAADALKGDINFVAGANVASTPNTRAGRFLFHEGSYDFGLDIDLPIDRLDERNAYRRSLIDYDASVRGYMEAVDTIKQDIRESLRQLKRTEQTYQIAEESVRLALRRVDSTKVELDAGRATTRDLLEAQEALVDAQNSRTEALVSHLVTRLEFQRDTELLEVDEEGQIHEIDIEQLGTSQPTTDAPAR
jgi:outer membrane protein TolC